MGLHFAVMQILRIFFVTLTKRGPVSVKRWLKCPVSNTPGGDVTDEKLTRPTKKSLESACLIRKIIVTGSTFI